MYDKNHMIMFFGFYVNIVNKITKYSIQCVRKYICSYDTSHKTYENIGITLNI